VKWQLSVLADLSTAPRPAPWGIAFALVPRRPAQAAFRDATLADLALLPIKIAPDTECYAWSAPLRLAEHHRLTLCDAAYLKLALRRRLPLVSLNMELRAAANAENVVLYGL